MKKIIYLSGDHAGFNDKGKLKEWLKKKKYEVKDFGPRKYNKNDDYPEFVSLMVKAMKRKSNSVGIVIAGSGMGEAIAANKFRGIRAAVYHGKNLKIVKTTREHNDSNILCMGSRFVKLNEMKKATELFLRTKFKGGRHLRRLKEIEKLTK